ncbi:MAG: hypothetical protein M3X11_20460 [Acidobacteriota bacterium]|nr:hypothetical protein [Acidobacteriota bacterium]
MSFDEWVQPRLKTDAEEAAGVLRLALAEAETDPRTLLLTVRTVIAARGNLEGLGLNQEELLTLVYALAGKDEQLSKAA